MFTPDQLKSLNAKLDPADVKTRSGAGGKVPYVEAWDVLDKANIIFGHGNWDRETKLAEVHPPVPFTPSPTRENPHPKDQVVACYRAKVRITVWDEAHQRRTIREGCGASRAFAMTVGEAVENALKAAETDATKRALASFGWQFGLALYDKERRNVGVDAPAERQLTRERDPVCREPAPIDDGFDDRAAPTISQRAIATVQRQARNGIRY
jgi:DNA repair and recombination protein RAD52